MSNPEATATRKKCNRCKRVKDLEKFYKSKSGFLGRESKCKLCRATTYDSEKHRKSQTLWRQKNRAKVRNYNHKSRYGITYDERLALSEECNGLCVCGEPVTDLDHRHKDKKVRGLLCHNCNVALGLVKDSPETLRRLADYLEGSLA